jgi:hypothetical protein
LRLVQNPGDRLGRPIAEASLLIEILQLDQQLEFPYVIAEKASELFELLSG